jgi:hypothetical protein
VLRKGLRPKVARVEIDSIQPRAEAARRRAIAGALARAGRAEGEGSPLAQPDLGGSALQPGFDFIQAPPPPASGGPGVWIDNFLITEYYPTLERWFSGPMVIAPGLSTPHRQDWLYSDRGVRMEGDGIGLDGQQYHISNATPPYAFAPGPSRPLGFYRSVAVDPSFIPLGSRIFIPAYRKINGGWFQAEDTGGAIIGAHLDVFRPPPASFSDLGGLLRGQRVYVVRA